MKEIRQIIKAYEAALLTGKRMALATVVHVEGSSYRRPGARMLVTDDGQLTGAISGGCLEGDALRKALLAISQQKNKLVTYDTTDDDTNLGVQLGCNGIVHILFEPIHIEQENHPIALLKHIVSERIDAVLVTLFSLNTPSGTQPGTRYLHQNNTEKIADRESSDDFLMEFRTLSQEAFRKKDAFFKKLTEAHHGYTAFVEFLAPAPSVVIAGAGNDTIPLCEMASVLGWDVTVVDGRTGYATSQRFPHAKQLIQSKADQVLSQLECDERTFFLLMTHNYNYDLALLESLLPLDSCPYIGALGPKKKLEKMYDELAKKGLYVTDAQKKKVFGPVGLDIGAETSEEIALSVLSEIQAVLQRKNGTSLREKTEPIHSRSDQREEIEYSKSVEESFMCGIQSGQF